MKIDKFVNDVKEKIALKNELLESKKEILERIKNGEDFFSKATTDPVSPNRLMEATKLIRDLANQLNKVESEIIDTDIILVTMLEAYLTDIVIKCNASQKINDAGDNIRGKSFTFVPYKDNEDFIEITPDDLWFLKIIKPAIGIRNVEVISKNDYYSE